MHNRSRLRQFAEDAASVVMLLALFLALAFLGAL